MEEMQNQPVPEPGKTYSSKTTVLPYYLSALV